MDAWFLDHRPQARCVETARELARRNVRTMAAAGTLLQDLDSTSGGDNDLVQKILSDMNVQSAPGPRPIPPAMPAQTPMAEQRMAPGNSQFTMDSTIPTSHMIGNQHPSPADFAAAVAGARPQEAMYTMPVGVMPGAGASSSTFW